MKTFGLLKKERLLKPFQFKSVYNQGCIKKSGLLWTYVLPNGLGYNRVGISVSKKYCENLVVRNRVKRLIREIYRLNKEKFGQSRDIVFVLKQKPKELEYGFFQQCMLEEKSRK